jgi:hypothetical protein
MGMCYASSWMEEQSLYQLHHHPADEHSNSQGEDTTEVPRASEPPFFPGEPDADYQPHTPSSPLPNPFHNDVDNPSLDQGDVQMDTESFDDEAETEPRFTESYPGCSTAFPGGLTFMQSFWQDKHAEERHENLYFPFASNDEWQFVSWCMRSGLSMAAIDSLLSLNVVSEY